MRHWIFLDFITANGRNVITDWIDSQPAGTRQKLKSALNTLLTILEKREDLDRPSVGQLRGQPCKGLFELVLFVDKIQFRPIGCYGPANNEFTLLAGAAKKGGNFIPPGVCVTAQTRRQLITQRSHVREHRFD